MTTRLVQEICSCSQPNPTRSVRGLGRSVPKLGWLLLPILCAGSPLALAAPGPMAEAGQTLILTIEGRVETARRGTQEWTPAQTNQVLQAGDRLRTGPRSRATLRLSDLSVLRVNELTTLEVQPPQAPGAKPGLDLRAGAVYFFNRERPGQVEFRTPLASGAIRGTEFHLAVEADGTTVLTLLDGEVTLTAAAQTLALQSGEQGIVQPGQPPRKAPAVETINIIQWVLYYPAVLDPDELGLSAAEQQALAESLAAYRAGDLLQALAAYPLDRQPSSEPERLYRAAVLLAAGQVEQWLASVRALTPETPLARALREVVAAVKGQTLPELPDPQSGSEWLARSYYHQSRADLEKARAAAAEATRLAPRFGPAWIRLAEMEFSFGQSERALAALDRGLSLAPRHAQAKALQGFVLCAQRQFAAALDRFEQAIALDGGLANGWLGRGLLRLRAGQVEAGRADLQVAAALEPQRSVLRSYLGKAWTYTRDWPRATRELSLAQKLDPNDPTGWLYSALLNQQQNRINAAVRDLERSRALNDNRCVYRSRLLLDQDRAVRSANLAAIYRDAGLPEVSLRQAARAVTYDYANYSAHLFLAESYAAWRDPRTITLRYETPFFSELLLAQLMAPVGAGNLSQYISHQEYSALFEGDRQGLFSRTWYDSSGDWVEEFSQYGTIKNFMYAVDLFYRDQDGWRPNNDLRQAQVSGRFKYQLTPQDSLWFQAAFYNAESGDILQYYNPADANRGLRIEEEQHPNLFVGYHHEWQPGVHTLFLATWLTDTVTATNPFAPVFTLNRSAAGVVTNVVLSPFNPNSARFRDGYESDYRVFSGELQQLWQQDRHTLVAGGRVQVGQVDTFDRLDLRPGSAFSVNYPNPAALSRTEMDVNRFAGYAYYGFEVMAPLQLIAGLSYDYLHYPVNTDYPPLSEQQAHKSRWSPKAGLIWTPTPDTVVRFGYTRSLGGLFHDHSVRLEPSQLAGFVQNYRSLIPESVVGPVPGTRFTTYGLGVDHRFCTWTYVGAAAELLVSEAQRTVGTFDITGPLYIVLPPPALAVPGSTRQSLEYRERALSLYAGQLLGEEWVLGARYRLAEAELEDVFLQIPRSATHYPGRDVEATFHQLDLSVRYNHRCGFFAEFGALWTHQHNRGYSPRLPGDDFWQFNLWAGYRLWQRRVEARVGILNLTDQDYRLNPLNFYLELPRERLFAAMLKLNL